MQWENRLKLIRERHNMTQEELEKASGVSRVTISNIERGALKNMKVDTMRTLAHALHEKPENIFLL